MKDSLFKSKAAHAIDRLLNALGLLRTLVTLRSLDYFIGLLIG